MATLKGVECSLKRSPEENVAGIMRISSPGVYATNVYKNPAGARMKFTLCLGE